ncbi:MAG TPA: ATP-binding protein [Steroidobacteraceae bacterium]|nr:ATP-binding protein [Steroidobacteraceae bacterium]
MIGDSQVLLWLAFAGALFAIFAGASVWLVARRTRAIEFLVARRTEELAHINEKLADEICDHLNTEHALDKERESLKAVLNNLHEGILVLDQAGQLRIANGPARRLYRQISGIELERLELFSAIDFLTLDGGASLPIEQLPQTRALNGETVRDFEIAVRAADDSLLTLRINGQPLYTSDGRQHGAVIVVRDITESKEIERIKSELVATVSHELRTPVTSIRGSLGLIAAGASGPLSERTKHLVDIALRNSDRLALLINDLLDMEKIESGKMRFQLGRHSLIVLIRQAIEANAAYAESHGVEISVSLPSDDAVVVVDPDRLLQVMANLLSNAAKFSPRGAIVDVAVTVHSETIRVAVRDRGPGIPDEFRGRIFQKFSQADNSDARAKSGTGLGLAICKALIERMDGTIAFDTDVGSGSTFYFDLPLAQEQEVVIRDA